MLTMKTTRSAFILCFSAIFSTLLIVSCQTPSNKAHITASISHCKDSVVLLNFIDSTNTISLGADGSFETEITLNKPLWLEIHLGSKVLSLYLQPGSDIKLDLDAEDLTGKARISGNDSEINEYLLKQNMEFENHVCNKTSYIYESEISDYLTSLADLTKKLQINYDAFVKQYGEKHRHFCDNEKLRLQFMLAGTKLGYSSFIDYSDQLSEQEKTGFYQFMKDIDLNKPENGELHEFRSFASLYVDWKANSESAQQKSQLSNEAQYMKFVFEVIQTEFSDKKTIEYLYYTKLYDFMLYMGPNDLEMNYEEFLSLSNNEQHKKAIKAIYDKWMQLAPGLPAPSFTCTDRDGKTHDLREFAGKLIVVDVWASWCGPCMREIPYIEKLKKEYRNKPVAFVAISVDDSYESWIAEVENSKLTGNQWFAKGWNNALCDAYNINSIPRFMLIDHKGNIVNTNAPKPSGDLKQLIDSWLNDNKDLTL